MNDEWTELAGFPRTFASQCAPWGSSVRFVNGAREVKDGRPVMLSGAKAFLQRIEMALIEGRRGSEDVAAVVEGVLVANARHIDSVEWCRVRGEDELDMGLRVYASRGVARVHAGLKGPVGRYAELPLPEAPVVAKAKKKATAGKQGAAGGSGAVVPEVVAAVPAVELAAPVRELLLRPVVAGAGPTYGEVIARDVDGRMLMVLRPPELRDAFVAVEPTGAVTVIPLASREELRAEDLGAMTGAMNAGVVATRAGVLRFDHYESSASGEQERVGFAGRWHAGRRGLYSGCWVLGVRGAWLLRCITNGKKATLVAVQLVTGKRSRVALPEGLDLRGAGLMRQGDGEVLRVLHGMTEERRYPLKIGKTIELDAAGGTVLLHGLAGLVQVVPDSGMWVAASDEGGCGLTLQRADRSRVRLFELPRSFTATGYAAWGYPLVSEIAGASGEEACWQVSLDFGSDHGPRCTGALTLNRDGQVCASAFVDVDQTLRIGERGLALGEAGRVLGYAGGPGGDLAALLLLADGVGLLWAPRSTAAQ